MKPYHAKLPAALERHTYTLKKMAQISQRSDVYGCNYCRDNAATLLVAVQHFRGGQQESTAPEVRVYDSVQNKIVLIPFAELLQTIPLDEAGMPLKLRFTPQGQVALSPTVHVSRVIYYVVQALFAVPSNQGE